jgi:hypothetical protein
MEQLIVFPSASEQQERIHKEREIGDEGDIKRTIAFENIWINTEEIGEVDADAFVRV